MFIKTLNETKCFFPNLVLPINVYTLLSQLFTSSSTTFIHISCIYNLSIHISFFFRISLSLFVRVQLNCHFSSNTFSFSWLFVLSNATSVLSQVASWSPGSACSDQSPQPPFPPPVWSAVPPKSQLTWTSSACPPPTELRSVDQLKYEFIENFF